MNDIQKARDDLKKWRKKANGSVTYRGGNMELIVGTAGNPDMLDALDSLLATAQRDDLRALGLGPLLYDAERIAETILSADERMSA